MYTAIVLVVETSDQYPVEGKFATRQEAIEACKQVVTKILGVCGEEEFTFDFVITPLE